MNGTVKEWIDKADADYGVASRELRVLENPSYDAVCFHAQQCIEKLMKAVLVQSKAYVPKIHDLVRLSRLVQDVDSSWTWPEEELYELSLAAVDARYPGAPADFEDARQMFDLCTRLRDRLRRLLQP